MRLKCAQNALNRELSAQEKSILEFIDENGSITSAKLMELLSVKKRRAQVILSQMMKDRLICKKGASKNTNYVLADKIKSES